MRVPRPDEIAEALALAEGRPGITRLLADMLRAVSQPVSFDGSLAAGCGRVLARLAQGPLSPSDWVGVASSSRALYGLIYKLRQDGVRIGDEAGQWVLLAEEVAA